MVKLRSLRWRDYPGWSCWPKWDHKSQSKRENTRIRVRENVGAKVEVRVL
jgi:hypothetical protein